MKFHDLHNVTPIVIRHARRLSFPRTEKFLYSIWNFVWKSSVMDQSNWNFISHQLRGTHSEITIFDSNLTESETNLVENPLMVSLGWVEDELKAVTSAAVASYSIQYPLRVHLPSDPFQTYYFLDTKLDDLLRADSQGKPLTKEDKKMSWSSAMKQCQRRVAGCLPTFAISNKLKDFLNHVKIIRGLPEIETLFIGLKVKQSGKVILFP